jgi:hypothetical protein
MTSPAIASACTSGSRASPVRTLPLCRITRLRVARPNGTRRECHLAGLRACGGARGLSPIGTRRECHLAASRRPPRPTPPVATVSVPCCRPAAGRGDDRRIAAGPGGPAARRDRCGADRAVRRSRVPERHGAERPPDRATAVGEPLLLVRARSGASAPGGALRRVEPFASLRALPAALSACGLPERLRWASSSDVVPAAAYPVTASSCRVPIPSDCMPALWSARSLKSAWELERIRLACEADPVGDGIRAAGARPRPPGVRCPQRARPSHANARPRGHDPLSAASTASFSTARCLPARGGAVPGPTGDTRCTAKGLSTAQGRGPSRRPLRRGDAVVIDLSGWAGGYVSGSDAHVLHRPGRARAPRRV